jgi:hypothetical protein
MCRWSLEIHLESGHNTLFILNIKHSSIRVLHFWRSTGSCSVRAMHFQGSKVPANVSRCQLGLIILTQFSSLPFRLDWVRLVWSSPLSASQSCLRPHFTFCISSSQHSYGLESSGKCMSYTYMHIEYMWTYFLKHIGLNSLVAKDLGHVLLTVLHVILIKSHGLIFQARY